jgi:hypothetical protein
VSDLIKKLESWAIKYQSLPLLQPYFYMYFVCSDENRIFPNHSQWPPTFHGAIYFLGCLSTHFIYISTSIYNTSLCTASLWEMMTSNLVRVLELRQWVEFLTNTNLTYVYIYLSLCVSERKLNLCMYSFRAVTTISPGTLTAVMLLQTKTNHPSSFTFFMSPSLFTFNPLTSYDDHISSICSRRN